jgi:hypothetical protein
MIFTSKTRANKYAKQLILQGKAVYMWREQSVRTSGHTYWVEYNKD